jgi:hypothetical protein
VGITHGKAKANSSQPSSTDIWISPPQCSYGSDHVKQTAFNSFPNQNCILPTHGALGSLYDQRTYATSSVSTFDETASISLENSSPRPLNKWKIFLQEYLANTSYVMPDYSKMVLLSQVIGAPELLFAIRSQLENLIQLHNEHNSLPTCFNSDNQDLFSHSVPLSNPDVPAIEEAIFDVPRTWGPPVTADVAYEQHSIDWTLSNELELFNVEAGAAAKMDPIIPESTSPPQVRETESLISAVWNLFDNRKSNACGPIKVHEKSNPSKQNRQDDQGNFQRKRNKQPSGRNKRSKKPLTQDQQDTKSLRYPCTVGCQRKFGSASDWKRHEENKYPQKLWFCTLCGDVDDASMSDLYYRKDKFLKHVRTKHAAWMNDHHSDGAERAITHCAVLLPLALAPFPSECMFCEEEFQQWDDRCTHLLAHFDNKMDIGAITTDDDDDNDDDDNDDHEDDNDNNGDNDGNEDNDENNNGDGKNDNNSRHTNGFDYRPYDSSRPYPGASQGFPGFFGGSVGGCYRNSIGRPQTEKSLSAGLALNIEVTALPGCYGIDKSQKSPRWTLPILLKEPINLKGGMGSVHKVEVQSSEVPWAFDSFSNERTHTYTISSPPRNNDAMTLRLRSDGIVDIDELINLYRASPTTPVVTSSSGTSRSSRMDWQRDTMNNELDTNIGDESYLQLWHKDEGGFSRSSHSSMHEYTQGRVVSQSMQALPQQDSTTRSKFGRRYTPLALPSRIKSPTRREECDIKSGKVCSLTTKDQHILTSVQSQTFAVKTYRGWHRRFYERELEAYSRLQHHPNVVKCFGSFLLPDPSGGHTYNLLLEYATGDMDEYFADTPPPTDSRGKTLMWTQICGIADALRTIHSGFVTRGSGSLSGWHADIKPSNILRVKGQFKLADFGFSKMVNIEAGKPITQVMDGGTLKYSRFPLTLFIPTSMLTS